MTDLMAVFPPRGRVVHLFVAGYQPGAKPRGLAETSMCGASVNEVTPPPVGPSQTGRVHVPLADAVTFEGFAPPPPNAPYSIQHPYWTWCAPCLGHAVKHFDLTATTLSQLVALPKEKES